MRAYRWLMTAGEVLLLLVVVGAAIALGALLAYLLEEIRYHH